MKGTDHRKMKNRLSRIEGQLRGIGKMIDEEKYCVDILTQFKAIRSALKSVELEILQAHMQSCLSDAIMSGDEDLTHDKIEEVMKLLRSNSKS